MISTACQDRSRLMIVGDYLFDPGVGLISGPSGAHYVSPNLSDLLCTFVESNGEVVDHDYHGPKPAVNDSKEALSRRVACPRWLMAFFSSGSSSARKPRTWRMSHRSGGAVMAAV